MKEHNSKMTEARYREILDSVKKNPLYSKNNTGSVMRLAPSEHTRSSLAGEIPAHDYSERDFRNSSLSKAMDAVSHTRSNRN